MASVRGWLARAGRRSVVASTSATGDSGDVHLNSALMYRPNVLLDRAFEMSRIRESFLTITDGQVSYSYIFTPRSDASSISSLNFELPSLLRLLARQECASSPLSLQSSQASSMVLVLS